MHSFVLFIFLTILISAAALAAGAGVGKFLKKNETIKKSTPLFLCGVMILTCFHNYFGQTDWIFSSSYGSEKGGFFSLILFILGFLIVNEAGIIKAEKNPLEKVKISLSLYFFVSGMSLLPSSMEFYYAVWLSVFFEMLVIGASLAVIISKFREFIFIGITFIITQAIGMIISAFIPELICTCFQAAVCGGLFCASIYLVSKIKKNILILLAGFSIFLILKLIG